MMKIQNILLSIPLFLFSWSPVTIQAQESILSIDNYINDHADVIDDDVEQELNEMGARFEKETGSQVIFNIETRLDNPDIRKVAYETFKHYELGDEDLDNGVLFVASIEDRLRYMEVGRGLEGILTDITSQHLQTDYLVPSFQEENYTEGIRSLYIHTIKTIESGIEEGSLKTAENQNASETAIDWTILIPIGLILVLMAFVAYQRRIQPSSTIILQPGETRELRVAGYDFSEENILISSQDSRIVSVEPSGKIQAHKVGRTKIFLQRLESSHKDYINVVVRKNHASSSQEDDPVLEALLWGSLLSSGRKRRFMGDFPRSGGFGGFHGGGGGSSRGGGAGGSW